DILGMVVATAVMGKNGEGDKLENFATDLTRAQIDAFFAAPRPPDRGLLGKASTRIVYDIDRFKLSGQPSCGAALAREIHASELDGATCPIHTYFVYSDGFGREIQKKLQAEPGAITEGGPVVASRWVASGWIIFNNKGLPVKRYEPFFDDT